MTRLTGLDADGCIISTEEYTILATRKVTEKENENINKHILEKLYECENIEEELKSLTNLFKKTFEWGCNDRAKALYANAVYAVISENKTYEECIDEFKDYVLENLG